jgi:hypothetical protein
MDLTRMIRDRLLAALRGGGDTPAGTNAALAVNADRKGHTTIVSRDDATTVVEEEEGL